ncbi:MAG: single-stranded-DNA-specific exonuclease RecJ [Planctomycetota bacterium]
MKRKWRIVPHDAGRVQQLVRGSGLPPVVAQLLVSRGVYDSVAADSFLSTKLTGLRDPQLLPGVPEATRKIIAAIEEQIPIVIYGDYDCDGMTGTAILYNTLKLLRADVSYHIPNRLEEGYGLNRDALIKLADRGKRMVISVDCGITSVACAELCRELGVQLIITDHHTLDEQLPDADAIVHPRLPGSTYAFGDLCGAGVAFKLAWSLCQSASGAKKVSEPMRRLLMQSLALAAIGTVADVVPLVDENRILVAHGLRMLSSEPLLGLSELMKVAKLTETATLNTESISFNLAPRLNASGRLGQAQLGVELLTTTSEERAKSLAEYIDQLNKNRDSLQRSVMLAAQKQIKERFDAEQDAALVLAGVGWHQGVIGVVAGRLSDRYAKPVIILSMDASGKSEAVGSGRVGGTSINLHAALSECSHRLVRFGGHRAAAGLTIDERQIDDFRLEFCDAVNEQMTASSFDPEIVIDAEAPLGQLNLHTVKQIETMEPFGAGNPRPTLLCHNVTLAEPARRMGSGDRHLTVRLDQGGKVVRGVAFGAGDWCDELNQCDEPIQIAYRPVINEFQGYRRVEIHLVDWRPASATAAAG